MSPRFKKFVSYYQPYKRLLFADLACAFVVSAIVIILPLCVGYVTKNILSGITPDTINQIYAMGAIMVALVIAHTACNMFVAYQGHMMGAYMERDIRRELFDHFQKLSFGFYDEQKTGQLMTRITNDTFMLSEFYHHGPEDLLIAVLKGVGSLIVLFMINVPLTVIVLLFLPVMSLFAVHFNRKMTAALRKSHERIGDINAQVEDTLAGIRVVKSFTNEAVEREKFAYANGRFLDSRREGYRAETVFFEGLIGFTQLITIIVIVVSGMAIVNASMDVADLLTYLLIVGILVEPIQRLINFARLYQEGITGFNRVMEILEVQPEIQNAPDAVELADVRGDIEFRSVSFKYKEELDHVLRDVSLTIRAGEYVALVGSSGVGKTTLCSLIPRFYDVSEGAVLIDGIDVRDIRLDSLRRNIGVVQQDVYLFAGTVAENIRYGKMGATDAEIIAAAKQANAHDFIMGLPDGYDTDIGQRGVKLSGGQKQRLSIARAFLKDPPIIIFDEATSALDNESEGAVRESMERLSERRTTLVIAHRLSTVRNAGRILVLTEQGIEEQGTHDQLIAMNGAYAGLYMVQGRI